MTTKTERIVSMPESTAVLIRKAFLPINPNKLRKPHIPADQLESLRQACRDFERALERAKDPARASFDVHTLDEILTCALKHAGADEVPATWRNAINAAKAAMTGEEVLS